VRSTSVPISLKCKTLGVVFEKNSTHLAWNDPFKNID